MSSDEGSFCRSANSFMRRFSAGEREETGEDDIIYKQEDIV